MAWQTTMRRILGLGRRAGAKPGAGAGAAENKQQALQSGRATAQPVREELALAAQEPPMTQEDWFWGRTTAGTEEDYLWRRLSDNWYMKDVQPTTVRILNPMLFCKKSYVLP